MIDGVEVTRNGYAINVQWYIQKTLGVSEYVLEANPPCVQTKCELVLADFDMHQLTGRVTRVPRTRTVRAHHMDTFGLLPNRSNLQTTEGDSYKIWKRLANGRASEVHSTGGGRHALTLFESPSEIFFQYKLTF